MTLQDELGAALAQAPDVSWGLSVRRRGVEVAAVQADRELPSASMGKVLLLLAAAQALHSGDVHEEESLELHADDRVGDSGLWQHLPERTLTWQAACVLVAAVSDNCAANALLRALGLARVQQVSVALGIPQTRLADRLRDVRTADDPVAPSWSRAADLALLMERIGSAGPDWPEGRRVRSWLALNTDLSMVAGAWALDPLAHARLADGGWLVNKTGTDATVRCDAGAWSRGEDQWSYAVLAQWDAGGDAPGLAGQVMQAMRRVGALLARQGPLEPG